VKLSPCILLQVFSGAPDMIPNVIVKGIAVIKLFIILEIFALWFAFQS